MNPPSLVVAAPRSRVDHLWRLLGTGLSFACFGIGAVLISLTLFPLIRLLSWNKARCRSRIQRAMHLTFRLFVWMMSRLGVISWEVQGRERLLQPGQLIVANHPTLIDVVLIIALMPEVDCIVKQALFRNPFLRWPVVWAGYIPNRDSGALIEDCARALRAGRSLLVFPEGTRTVPGQALALKRGAAQIALAAQCQVRPVGVSCRPLMLTKHEPWYRIPPRPGHWRLDVGEAIAAADFCGAPGGHAVAARRLTQELAARFAPYAQACSWV